MGMAYIGRLRRISCIFLAASRFEKTSLVDGIFLPLADITFSSRCLQPCRTSRGPYIHTASTEPASTASQNEIRHLAKRCRDRLSCGSTVRTTFTADGWSVPTRIVISRQVRRVESFLKTFVAPSLSGAASYAGGLIPYIISFCFLKCSGVPDIGIFRVVDDHARVLCVRCCRRCCFASPNPSGIVLFSAFSHKPSESFVGALSFCLKSGPPQPTRLVQSTVKMLSTPFHLPAPC
jgi:hypothetical protein